MMVRQGDILLVLVDAAAVLGARAVPREGDGVVIAHGEATGHRHRIVSRDAELCARGEEQFLRVRAPVDLIHEEHSSIELRPGVYKIVRQREYVPSSRPRTIFD
ncbi:MAG TPA: hypothetical protein VGD80_21055 [Kofleriaceae bacterium]